MPLGAALIGVGPHATTRCVLRSYPSKQPFGLRACCHLRATVTPHSGLTSKWLLGVTDYLNPKGSTSQTLSFGDLWVKLLLLLEECIAAIEWL